MQKAEYYFRRFDRNGDGLLSFDELQSSSIRKEKSRYDTNNDGVVDVGEYAAFLGVYLARQEEQRRNPSAGTKKPSTSGKTSSKDRTAERAKGYFKKFDRNKDGLLNADEMRQSKIRYESEKYDVNKDGVIDPTEYEVFYQVHTAREKAKSSDRDKSDSGKSSDPFTELDEKPVVFSVENVPDGAPSWFAQLDTNKDGQVALYEWLGKRSPAEFQLWDRNRDTLITPLEVMHVLKSPQSSADDKGGKTSKTTPSPSYPRSRR